MPTRLIDLDSIKKNPRAGQTTWPVIGRCETSVDEDGTIVSKRDVTFVRSMTPSPPHLFKYEPMNVECQYCLARFSVDDLGEDAIQDEDGGDMMICDICPECKNPDCVEASIQYETIEEALERREE